MTKAKAGGVVDLECDLVYNPIRAGIRTFLPKEGRVMGEEEETFKRKVRQSCVQLGDFVTPSTINSKYAIKDGLVSDRTSFGSHSAPIPITNTVILPSLALE